MFILSICVIIAIMWCVAVGVHRVQNNQRFWGKVQSLAVIPLIIGLALSSLASVPTGYTGIKTTFGRVEDGNIGAGIHLKAPWQRIVQIDNRTQKTLVETEAFSSDIQQVDLKVSVNYCINQSTAQTLYKTVGTDYYNAILYPRILEHTKIAFAQYTAESLMTNRSEIGEKIRAALSDDMTAYGINIVAISIEDVDFTDAFTDAVEAKQVAEQNKLKAQTEQAQKTMEAEAASQRQVIEAQAAAEVARINAKAAAEVAKIEADAAKYAGEKEAEMNRKLAESLTDALVRYYYANHWDGKLPQYVGGDGTLPIINFGE